MSELWIVVGLVVLAVLAFLARFLGGDGGSDEPPAQLRYDEDPHDGQRYHG